MFNKLYGISFALIIAFIASIGIQSAKADEGWTIRITPYLWATGLKGAVGIDERVDPIDVDASFSDVLDNLDMALMIVGDARKDRFSLIGDVQYLSLSTDDGTPGPLFSGFEMDAQMLVLTMMGGYAVVDEPNVRVELLGGLRFWDVDTDIDLTPGIAAGRSLHGGESWLDPTVGVRAIVPFSDDFSARLMGTVGGFGAGSDSSWEILASISYQINETIAISAGYRHLEIDYEEGGFVWDVQFSGPMAGLTFTF